MFNKLLGLFILLTSLQINSFAQANQVNFDELYILDRDKALKELIPGTDLYFHYHCLNAQSKNDRQVFDSLMTQWYKKLRSSTRYKQMLNRQALLDYKKSPEKTLAHIIKELKLQFNHQKIAEQKQVQYPNSLNQDLINWSKINQTNISYISNNGLEEFSKKPMNYTTRRHLLKRVKNASFANLPKLIIDDLNSKNSGQFGYLAIHKQLTKGQLDECLKLKPELIKYSNFVHQYIKRLRPANHVNWSQNPKSQATYLQTLWNYVEKLNPSFNSLKAHVLLQKLNLERSQGIFDEDLFLEYVKLPRNVPYINNLYNRRKEFLNVRANLKENFSTITGFAPVYALEKELSMDFFEAIFTKANNFKKFSTYVDAGFLSQTFAEVKLLHGLGDPQQWYAKFNPSQIKGLKDRIELRLLPQNIRYIETKKTNLKVAIKNVHTLLIKTYKINLFNYYKCYMAPVSTTIDLDGLVAANERTVVYKQNPQIRHNETFELDLKENGVYIVELIGNGVSSRSLVQKGNFRFTETESAAGHIFNIYNEQNKHITDAEIHLNGHVYKNEEGGFIRIPYSNSPRNQQIIIKQGDFASLNQFSHQSESYKLKAGFYINRESLVKNGSAKLLISPQLQLNGYRIPNNLLEKVSLTIRSIDNKGISSSFSVPDFKLYNNRESTYTIKIPTGLRSLSYSLEGQISKMTDGKKVSLRDSSSISFNNNFSTSQINHIYLRESQDGYYLEILGRTGEAIKGQAVNLTFHHKMLTRPVHITLKTNEKGEAKLGALKDIRSLKAHYGNISADWQLLNQVNYSQDIINTTANTKISIPFNWQDSPIDEQVCLIETRNNTPVSIKTSHIIKQGQYLEVDKLPAGNFTLYFKKSGYVKYIKTLEGKNSGAYVLGKDSYIRTSYKKSPVISQVKPTAKGLEINLENFSKNTHVHVFQSRFNPNSIPGLNLAYVGQSLTRTYDFSKLQSHYLSGRSISDEYRYILTRRSGKVYAGNMLERPGLLLNPWVLRTTKTIISDGLGGGTYRNESAPRRRTNSSPHGGRLLEESKQDAHSFDFLQPGQRCFSNLKPDKDGKIIIPQVDQGQAVHIVLIDGRNQQYKKAFLKDQEKPYRNLRFEKILNPTKHFVEKKKISTLSKGKDFILKSLGSAKVESYDSLRKVFGLMKTLNPDKNLLKFSFILDWPTLKEEEKLKHYSGFACHELNFFIYKKDPAFFKATVLPYMSNKKDKTFLDAWLQNTEDLTDFTQEWKYSRLNIVEKILLAHRNNNLLIKREIQDHFDMLKRVPSKLSMLFDSALQSEALNATNGAFAKGFQSKLTLYNRPFGSKRKPQASEFMTGRRISSKMEKEFKASTASLDKSEEADDDPFSDDDMAGDLAILYNKDSISELRKNNKQYYREIGAAKEWVESNYYNLPIEQHTATLVELNGFWKDYAAHKNGPFISANIAETTRNFTEMMFALSLLDLPFESAEIASELKADQLTLRPTNNLILFHREVEETAALKSNILMINQKYFDINNRYRMEGNEKIEKYLTEEFEINKVYGAKIIINNPSARNRKIEVLTQLPEGAIPMNRSTETMTNLLSLGAYSTTTIEYYFYFPFAGQFEQYPVHVSQSGKLLGYVKPLTFNVVEEPSQVDKTSWMYISQSASDAEVINFLKMSNLNRIDLNLTAWRYKNASFTKKVLALLSLRNHYHSTSYSYALKHNIRQQAAEYIKFSRFADQCGTTISSPLLSINPIERFRLQHREYSPLINARTYQLGARRQILNSQFMQQYNEFMKYLSYRTTVSTEDKLIQAYYLLLQDRVEEGINMFKAVKRQNIVEKIQYDYMNAYIQFYLEAPEKAIVIANKYKDYPIIKWRQKFLEVLSQANEASGKASLDNTKNRAGMQNHLASKEPTLELSIDNTQINVTAHNIKKVKVSYYLMDIELLFSRKPFIRQLSSDFSIIQPNLIETKNISDNKLLFDIPEKFKNSNVMVEVSADGVVETKTYYAHSMKVSLMKNYGLLQVVDPQQKPVSKVYVKVYSKNQAGQVKFYKDGYTDLRGKFDYSSVNTGNINNIQSFSILVLSQEHGAVIKEALPPKK